MLINFVKVNPSGNTTTYVLDTLPRDLYPSIAKELMREANVSCEQVGFIEKASHKDAYRLHMMGGEFCGNAARGLAAWIAYRNYPNICKNKDGQSIISLEVSGIEGVLKVEVKDSDAVNVKWAKISVPVPRSIKKYYINEEIGSIDTVDFGGIVHAVLLNHEPDINKFNIIKEKLEAEIGKTDAIGVMFFDENKHKIIPLVYVYELDSLIWESSCGSGTLSVGCVMAKKAQESIMAFELDQPGGALTVDILWDDGIKEAYLSGDITIVAQGTVFVDTNS